jgi:hypothetical protein
VNVSSLEEKRSCTNSRRNWRKDEREEEEGLGLSVIESPAANK